MKKCLSILAIGLLFLTSCLNELQGDREEATGPSNIAINISAKPQTKLGTASDGDVMKNLHIWLVYGTTVKGYLCQDDADCNITGSTATATFKNVSRGACTLYLVANLQDNTLPDAFGVGSTITDDFLKYVLPAVEENTHEPPYGASTPGMPLSTSVSLSVGAGTNKVSAELVRTCAKLTITVRNNTTENTIILKDLILSDKNPQVGYLFEQPDYSIPSAAQPFTSFDSISYSADSYVTDVIPQGGERIYVQQYMYETATDGAADLGFRIVGGLFPNGTDRAKVVNVVTGGGGTKTEYYFDPSNKPTSQSAIPTGTPCLIKSRDNDYYLCDNNGTLKAGSLNPGNQIVDSTYLWVFSSSSTTTSIKNLKTNKYISTTSINMSESSVNITTDSSSPFRFYIYSSYRYYALSVSSGTVSSSSAWFQMPSNASYFVIYVPQKVDSPLPETSEDRLFREDGTTPADVYFDKNIPSLNYINKYGIPVPLEQIRRNQDVKIVVNIHYNPNSGVLFFETCDWEGKDKNHETTFD